MRTTIAVGLLAALLAAGCASVLPGTPTPGKSPRPSVAPVVDPNTLDQLKPDEIANLPVEDLGGVQFKAITQDNAHSVGSAMASSSSGVARTAAAGIVANDGAAMAAPAAAPMAAKAGVSTGATVGDEGGQPQGASTAGGAYSGNSDAYYGYGYWFGGDQQMSLVSMTEGEAHGVSSFKELVAIVNPMIKDWDPQARLQETSADLGTDGTLFKPTPEPSASAEPQPPLCGATTPQQDFWTGNAWRVTYRSTRRNEVLQISGRSDKTVIVRMRWAPLDLDLTEVQTDAGAAITKVAAAIQDKTAEAEEEKTKLDYFLGVPFNQRTGMEWQDPRYTKFEVLYEVPPNAHWNASLDRVLGKLVWNLSFSAYDNQREERERQQAVDAFHAQGYAAFGLTDPRTAGPAPKPSPAGCLPYYGYPYFRGEDGAFFLGFPQAQYTPVPTPGPGYELYQGDPNVWINMSSNAMVDAKTGTLIRFSRPTKTINVPPPYLRELQPASPPPIPLPSVKPL